jgi:hypothetical protein
MFNKHTRSEPCGVARPESAYRNADGTCAGRCRKAISNQCPGDSTCMFDGGECGPAPPCISPPEPRANSTFQFTMKYQGFPGHPGAHVYIPSTFNSSQTSLSLIIHIHGFNNCISNCVLSEQYGCNCSVGGDHRVGYNLTDSFEAAAQASRSGSPDSTLAQSLFVAIEVAYDQASSDPGAWATPGLFANFISELIGEKMVSYLGGKGRTLSDVRRVRIFSHSGGYNVAGALATVGGVQTVFEINLLDSLYGDFDAFDMFVRNNLPFFGPLVGQIRFHSFYTDSGGTAANNLAMEVTNLVHTIN